MSPTIAQGLLSTVGVHHSPTSAQFSLSPGLNLPSPSIFQGTLCSLVECLSPASVRFPLVVVCEHTADTSAHSPLNSRQPYSLTETSG